MSDPDKYPYEGQERPSDEPPPAPPPGAQGSYGTTPPPPPPPGGWQQPGAMPPPSPHRTTDGPGQPAGLWPRFAARLVDYILLTLVNVFVVGFVVVGMLVGTNGGTTDSFGMDNGTSWAAGAVSSLLSAAIALGYFSIMEASRGQTVGKMLLNLETRGPGGGRPTTEQALRRNAFTAIGVLGIIPFLGFVAGLLSLAAVIMIAVTINKNTVTRRGWHDDFAGGTLVVKTA
jgi:uncharacterized RDD family membrane protein YckC